MRRWGVLWALSCLALSSPAAPTIAMMDGKPSSTALDFRALLKQERAKALAARKKEAQPKLVLGVKAPLDLDKRQVSCGVKGISYISEWLTREESALLLKAIDEVSQDVSIMFIAVVQDCQSMDTKSGHLLLVVRPLLASGPILPSGASRTWAAPLTPTGWSLSPCPPTATPSSEPCARPVSPWVRGPLHSSRVAPYDPHVSAPCDLLASGVFPDDEPANHILLNEVTDHPPPAKLLIR
jgi:hypothetical protein